MKLAVFFGLVAIVLVSVPRSTRAQESRAVLDAPLVVTGSFDRITDLADRDGDGWMDAYGWWESNTQSIRVFGWRNDGTGRLVLDYTSPDIALTDYVTGGDSTVADLNNDGRDDYVIGVTDRIRIFLTSPEGVPVLSQAMLIGFGGGAAGSIVAHDFDGDGWKDLAVHQGTISILHNTGSGVFAIGSQMNAGSTNELITAEVTGDGEADLIAAYHHFDNVYGLKIFPVVGSVIQPGVLVPTLFTDQAGFIPAAGDLDGDGDIDIVMFGMGYGPYPPKCRVLRRTSPTQLVAEPAYVGGPARRLRDLDADGDLDAVCCGGSYSPPQSNFPSVFRIALNDGHGRFAKAIEFSGSGSARIAGVNDLDHDGDLDLVAGRCVYYAHGPITQAVAPVTSADAQFFRPPFDFDDDGDPDFEPSMDRILVNQGTGQAVDRAINFPIPAGFVADPYFRPMLGGDFDGDGRADALVFLRDTAIDIGRTRFFHGAGGGQFFDANDAAGFGETITTYTSWHPSFVLDVDGDGDLDVVSRYYSYAAASHVWRNDGTGHFVQNYTFPAANESFSAAADLNGDGIPEAITTGSTVSSFAVRTGWGDGTFGPPTTYTVSGYLDSNRVATADFDGDGDQDVALIESSTSGPGAVIGGVRLYTNDGTGSLALTHSTPIPNGSAWHLLALDLNADGRPDLAASADFNTSVTANLILRRADNTGFEAPVQQTVHGTFQLALDADGDGDLDLVGDRLHRNRRFVPPQSGVRLQLDDDVAGSGGFTPCLGGNGPFRVGHAVSVELRGGVPGARGTFFGSWITPAPTSFPSTGGMLHVRPQRLTTVMPITLTGIPTSLDGTGTWSLPYVVPTYKAGRTYHYFAEIDDPASPMGHSRTNTLSITYGP